MPNVEIVEGKDHPWELRPSKLEDHSGKTGGLLLQMLKKYFIKKILYLILVSVFGGNH